MPLRELLYYPPFFAVLALALFIGVAFLTLILLERRRVRKMRRELRPGMPADRAAAAPREETVKAPVQAREAASPVSPEAPVAPILTRAPAAIPQAAESAALPAK